MEKHALGRRQCLAAGVAWASQRAWPALGLAMAGTAQAQPQSGPGIGTKHRLVQLTDSSADQQELSRDYASGLQLAWRGEGLASRSALARPPLHVLPLDGSQESTVRATVARLAADPSVLALVGTVGDRLALRVHEEVRRLGWAVPHLVPWLADPRFDGDGHLLCLFASRNVQMQQAVAAVRGMGVDELCVLYGSAADAALYDPHMDQVARTHQLRLQRLTALPGMSPGHLAAQLPATSGMVLSTGTSAELALLTQGMAARRDRRFVLGLGDVDAGRLQQLTLGRGVPVILTQVVPNPQRAGMPVVAAFRKRHNELFDEAPSGANLAGYVAGLYMSQLLTSTVDATGRLSPELLLSEVAKRKPSEVGGWRVDFKEDRRGSRFVTLTLLGAEGRLVG